MDAQQQREQLLDYGDLLKLSLAGLLREFELETWQGARKKGRQIFYGMQSAGYCTQPWENVNYASCHDNQTLFDQVHGCYYASASKWCSNLLDAMRGMLTIEAKKFLVAEIGRLQQGLHVYCLVAYDRNSILHLVG